MTADSTNKDREILARKKLHEIATKKVPEEKRNNVNKGITKLYATCKLQKICTLSNFQKIYNGSVKIPSWRIIWALRSVINPAEWFFYDDEKPGKKDLVDITPKTMPDFRESENFARIKEKTGIIGRNADIAEWCEKIGTKYITLYMIRSGQRPITTSFVFKMRKAFPPHLWFEKEKPHDHNNNPDSK